jgi:hypothetical protein
MKYTEPRKKTESPPTPNEGQNVKPNGLESEVEPELEDDSEVDMDKEKTKTYPKIVPPELY